jgi:2-polyprenyl-3-methyl-5-hydroxy-6-metoxy-1,4-benzoquinol methylase
LTDAAGGGNGLEAQRCLSVVMPCFNEAATVAAVIDRVLASPYTGEVIVVDDGSTDGTTTILADVDDPRVRVLTQPRNQGKGAALRRGFAAATLPYVIVQDADWEYDPAEYGTLLAPLLDGRADVVFGSRFHTSRPHRVLYYWHSVGNRVLTTISNMVTNLSISDMETCYKVFRREVLESFDIEESRFGIEPEITAKVARGGWRVYEVGISYSGRTYAEGKKIGWRDGVRALFCILRYSTLGERLRFGGRLRPRSEVGPAAADEADEELADTLDNLDDADHYADWIYSLMAPYLGKRVIEVGAGHGTLTDRLVDGRTVTATDLSNRCVAVLQDRYADIEQVTVVEGDIDDAAGLGQFDSVVLVNVLEHIADDARAVRSLEKALSPGGHLVLFVPAFDALYSDFDRRIGHHRRYRAEQLGVLVTEAGLEVVDLRYVNMVGAVAWWVLATKLGQTPTKRWSALTFDRVVVPVVSRLERRWRPPFGQSVLCVARRP